MSKGDILIRPYERKKDRKAVFRIFREVGWADDDDKDRKGIDIFHKGANVWVAEINGAAEAVVSTMPGDYQHLETRMPLGAVTGVTVSRIARRQRLASRVTAQAIAADVVERGAVVSGLGMFDQGFYDRLGFGTGPYENLVAFDPASISLPKRPFRMPSRLSKKNWREIHQALLDRQRGHGSCSLFPGQFTRSEMVDHHPDGFALGYYDGADGSLSHFIYMKPDDAEHGPYDVYAMAYQNREQLLELFGVLHSLGGQVHLVRMEEPAGLQLQDIIRQPLRYRHMTRRTKFEIGVSARAYWQVRINDLPQALAHTHLPWGDLRFNLVLDDPISAHLPAEAGWRGAGGEYVVTLGKESAAEAGQATDLPTLKTNVAVFTRLWMGVLPASGLALTSHFDAPEGLIEQLDVLLRLPKPRFEWDY